MKKRKKPAPKFPELDALADAFVAKGVSRITAAQATRECAETVAFITQISAGVSQEVAVKAALDACQELAELLMGDVVMMDMTPSGYPKINVEQYLDYHRKVRH